MLQAASWHPLSIMPGKEGVIQSDEWDRALDELGKWGEAR